MGVFANMPFAENLGTGGLGDGFVGLGEPDSLRIDYYDLKITLPGGSSAAAIPTLTGWGLIVLTLFVFSNVLTLIRRRQFRPE